MCESVTVADSTVRRMWGLLGHRALRPGDGIVLRPAWSIHTAFMRFPIDAVFVDPEQVVLRIEHRLQPFKTASCRGAREVVELAGGECERRGLAPGDRIAWASRNVASVTAPRTSPMPPASEITVVIASADQRFVKLTRFLLGGRGLGAGEQSLEEALSGSFADVDVDAVLLDAGDCVGDGLRALNALRAERPELPIVLVAESPGEHAPTAVSIYDKWHQTEAALDAIEEAVGRAATL